MPTTSARCSPSTSTRCSCSRASGASTRSTSSASSWARRSQSASFPRCRARTCLCIRPRPTCWAWSANSHSRAEPVTTTPAVEDLKRLTDALKAGVALADATGPILYSHRAFSGVSFTETDRARLTQAITRVCEGKAASAVIDATLEDGRFVQVALSPASGHLKPAEVVLFVQDVGALREAEGATSLATARMLALAEAVPIAVM